MGFSDEREPEWDSEGESSDEEFWGVPRFRLSPGLRPQVIHRRPMPPSPPVEEAGGRSEEEEELPDVYLGVSKDQILRVIRDIQDMGIPMDLPVKYNKMSREALINTVRETYGDEMDSLLRGAQVRPGGRVRLTQEAIRNAFQSKSEWVASSFRDGGIVVSRGRRGIGY